MASDYTGTAIDSDVIEQLEPAPDDANDEPSDDYNEPEETEEDITDEPEESPTTFNIDGEDITIDQIKEWRNSGLRQSDYTRKTQELARQRAELNDAVQTYNYLKEHPYITESIKKAEANPQFNNIAPSAERDAIRDLQYQMSSMKVDNQLQELHNKYGDFDEEQLFGAATNAKTNDLELVLKSLMYDKKPSTSAIEEAKEQLKKELEKDRDVVSTTIENKASKTKRTPKLTNEELRVAEEFGMDPREYAKWK